MSKLKIGIVGAGAIAREHIKALKTYEDVEIVGIVARTRQNSFALANEFGTKSFNTVSDMASNFQLDGVIIAVNVLNTSEVIKQCCNIAPNILVEKPVSLNFKEAISLEAYIKEKKNSGIFVAHNRRFYNATSILNDELHNIGSPRVVCVTDQQDPQEATKVYGQDPTVANNFMFANSIHLVDYLRHFCRGKIIDVQIISPFLGNIEHVITSKITFDSGDTGYYKCAWCAPGPWSVEVHCGEHYFQCKPLERLTQRSRYSRKDRILSEDEGSLKPGFSKQANEFIAACRTEPNNLVTIAESIDIMKLISAIFDSESSFDNQ